MSPLLVYAALSASILPVTLQLGKEGDIPAWLVAGPFPNEGALQLRGTGYKTDYLATEPDADPHEGKAIPATSDGKATPWALAIADGSLGIDLRAIYRDYHPGIAYAFARLVSDRDRRVEMRFGSDDGGKVWLNGIQLYGKQIARGVIRDEETLQLDLKAGTNRLLFKIEQGDGGWGLVARLVDPTGVTVRLDLEEGAPKTWAERAVRAGRGQDEAVDAETAAAYGRLHDHAAFWVDRFRADADRPERLDAAIADTTQRVETALSARQGTSPAFASALSELDAAYRSARAPFLAQAQNPGPLVDTDPKKEDFIRAMPGGRFFADAKGRAFTPIGYNHNPDWTTLHAANPLNRGRGYDPKATDAWFAKLQKNGVNLVRLMVETPPSGNLEDPVGTFQPEHLRWLDHVIAAARRHSVRLMVTPYDTFWMNRRWETTTYSPLRGGPVVNKIDWYTHPRLREAHKRRMRLLIDRYGNLGTVFAWELMNEADIWWGATPAQLQAWADDLVPYVREYQRKKWGRDHLVTVSMAEAVPKGGLADFAFRRKDFDLATTHLYLGVNKAPTEPYGVIATMETGVRHALAEIRDRRPYMDTENGPIDRWIADVALDNHVHHEQSWSHLAAGGAGSGLRWPYRGPHHLTDGMLANLASMRKFADAIDWKLLTGELSPAPWRPAPGLAGTSFATGKAALAYVTRTGSDLSQPATVELQTGWKPKRVRLYDTWGARWIEGARLEIPAGVRAVAVFATK